MSDTQTLIELEKAVEAIPGVLGCVILAGPDDQPSEIQAFARLGTDLDDVRKAILTEVDDRALSGSLAKIFVFELEAESHFGDRESLLRAVEVAEQDARARGPISQQLQQVAESPEGLERRPRGAVRRPPLRQVSIASSLMGSAEAEVILGGEPGDVVGRARGDATPHSLRILAQATLQAASKLVTEVDFGLAGASLVSVLGRDAIMVLVRDGELETVGAALVREGPISEAAVRATLDAINRRLAEG
jgi:hypothetical protein